MKLGWINEGNVTRLSKLLNPARAVMHMVTGAKQIAELVESETFRSVTAQQILDTQNFRMCPPLSDYGV